MRKFGYTDKIGSNNKMKNIKNENRDKGEPKYFEEKYRELLYDLSIKNKEIATFKNEINTLKKSNDDLNIRAVFAETLIKVIEEEHNIKIKKKFNSKH